MATIINQIQDSRPDLAVEIQGYVNLSVAIEAGHFVSLNTALGTLIPANVSASNQFIGIALESGSYDGVSVLNTKIKVKIPKLIKVLDAGAALADCGKKAYIANSSTITLTAGFSQNYVGVVVGVEVGVSRTILVQAGVGW